MIWYVATFVAGGGAVMALALLALWLECRRVDASPVDLTAGHERIAVHTDRDDAVAVAIHDSADGAFVVIHHKPCTDGACSCERPEVHRVERGRA